ncbi:protein lethal(2)essential for life-like [Belonocnema kinseyi]|uniref:protein lethal(2)essential for life-like n=1 Tax=Belonocnema kinseyi TaxID=2817044 RepID=UPI00143DAB77|nr:protein lethal(2)essential for life-like [Belonocnema kinseyi]
MPTLLIVGVEVVLDIQQFTPEEETVKVVDKFVMVEGKHEEKQDEHGWVARTFTRKYLVPQQCDLGRVKSSLSSSQSILTITAPRKHHSKHHREKHIEIKITDKPMIREGEHKPENKLEKKLEKK